MSRKKVEKSGKKAGFSIIEVVVATSIVAMTFMAMMTLFANNLRLEIINRNKITASYLAQEGIEIVKQQRDSNWFSNSDWRRGIPQGEGFFSLEDQNNVAKGWTITSDGRAKKVYLHDGAYVQLRQGNTSDCKETGFTRTVNIGYAGDNALRITVSVGYNEERNHVEVTSYLYNGWFN